MRETIGLRSRGGQDSLDTAREVKLTPTPRRSIHSFRVSETETSKQVIARTKEGTENGQVVSRESSGGFMKFFSKIFKLSAVLALLVAVYLAFTYKNDDATSFDEILDAVNTAQAEAPPAANFVD